MIWFACTKCRSKLSRIDSEAGAFVFCACGQGLRVPWSSTTTEDVLPPASPPEKRPLPAPRPLLDAEPVLPSTRVPDSPAPTTLPIPSRRPARLTGKVNPNFCFHHDEAPSTTTCSACRLPFCDSCVVPVQDKPLCGPCKNFRLASPGQPRRVLPLAVIAFVVALASGPVALTLSLAAVGLVLSDGQVAVGVAMCLLASAVPTAGLTLSALALGRMETRPQTTGRGLAASAGCTALAGVLWCATVAMVLVSKHLFN